MAKQQQEKTGEVKTVDAALALANTKLNASIKKKFLEVTINPQLKWENERSYVLHALERSEFLCGVFLKNPQSAIQSLLDAASMGLSLSPTTSLAYLIPQRPKWDLPYEIILKVSYKGMEQAVLASGSVTGINTQLVYAGDTFELGSTEDGQYLKFVQARGDRGELEGCFCSAKYANGYKHIEWMPKEDIQACYEAAKKSNNGKEPPAWVGDFKPEMQKKSCVRRAYKHWPANPVIERVMREFDRENPMIFGQVEFEAGDFIGDEQLEEMDKLFATLPENQRAIWYQRKAKAEGYNSIRDVPLEKFEKVKKDLLARLAQVNNLTDKSRGTIEPNPEEAAHENN